MGHDTWAERYKFVTYTLDVLEAKDPTQPTMLGLIWSDASIAPSLTQHYHPEAFLLAQDSRIDVHSVHNYFASQDALRSLVWDATHIRDHSAPTLTYLPSKPVVATENGSPGAGYHYSDSLRHAMEVRRDDLGPGERGIGSMPFVATVGWNLGKAPFLDVGGVFYGDGKVRDLAVVQAYMLAANAQQFTPTGIPNLIEKPSTDSDFVPQSGGPTWVPREWDEFSEKAALLDVATDYFAMFNDPLHPAGPRTFRDYVDLRSLFTNMSVDIIAATLWVGDGSNMNPYVLSSPPPPAGSVPPASVSIANLNSTLSQHIVNTALTLSGAQSGSGASPFLPTHFTAAIESLTGAVFDPQLPANYLQRQYLAVAVFPFWAGMIRGFVLLQNDDS